MKRYGYVMRYVKIKIDFYLFRSAESSENALISGIPVYNIFTHK